MAKTDNNVRKSGEIPLCGNPFDGQSRVWTLECEIRVRKRSSQISCGAFTSKCLKLAKLPSATVTRPLCVTSLSSIQLISL